MWSIGRSHVYTRAALFVFFFGGMHRLDRYPPIGQELRDTTNPGDFCSHHITHHHVLLALLRHRDICCRDAAVKPPVHIRKHQQG